jgi:hypothetical protein
MTLSHFRAHAYGHLEVVLWEYCNEIALQMVASRTGNVGMNINAIMLISCWQTAFGSLCHNTDQ